MSLDVEQAITTAIEAVDEDALAALVAQHPGCLVARDGEGHTPLDGAMWKLLVGDWSRPPRIADDPDGRRMGLVRLLLDAGSDVNAANADGWTPLHTAQYQGHTALTDLLLARGADPTAEAYAAGGTPVVQALFWGHPAAADRLARERVSPENLRVAAGLGDAARIDACFGADGTLTTSAGAGRDWYRPHTDFPDWAPSDDPQEILDEALSYAARNGRIAAMEELVARGARVSSEVYAGTPLMWAASTGRLETLRWLLASDADVNQKGLFGTQRGATPLHCAAWLDRPDVLEALLDAGADPTIHDDQHDTTPMSWAEFGERPNALAYLRQRLA